MPASTQPLLAHLRARNPQLVTSTAGSRQNTRSGSIRNPWDHPRRIVKWRDFEYDTLQSIYGGTLREVLEKSFDLDDVFIPRIPLCQIYDEDSLQTLLIRWNLSVTTSALSAAQGHLKIRRTEKIYMCKGGQAKWPGESNKRRRPDWAAVKDPRLDDDSEDKPRNLLPGDTKPSRKWSSVAIIRGDIEQVHFNRNWYQPMAQIFTYCVRNDARYGYIITDKELVVVRVGPTAQGDSTKSQPSHDLKALGVAKRKPRKDNLKNVEATDPYLRALKNGYLEYKAIPWHACSNAAQGGSAVMTVNLALFWLHIMAANENTIEDEYAPLKDCKWSIDTDTDSQASSFSVSEGSQDRPPFAERSFNSGLGGLSLGGKKQSRSSDVEDAGYIGQANPQKRRTRQRK